MSGNKTYMATRSKVTERGTEDNRQSRITSHLKKIRNFQDEKRMVKKSKRESRLLTIRSKVVQDYKKSGKMSESETSYRSTRSKSSRDNSEDGSSIDSSFCRNTRAMGSIRKTTRMNAEESKSHTSRSEMFEAMNTRSKQSVINLKEKKTATIEPTCISTRAKRTRELSDFSNDEPPPKKIRLSLRQIECRSTNDSKIKPSLNTKSKNQYQPKLDKTKSVGATKRKMGSSDSNKLSISTRSNTFFEDSKTSSLTKSGASFNDSKSVTSTKSNVMKSSSVAKSATAVDKTSKLSANDKTNILYDKDSEKKPKGVKFAFHRKRDTVRGKKQQRAVKAKSNSSTERKRKDRVFQDDSSKVKSTSVAKTVSGVSTRLKSKMGGSRSRAKSAEVRSIDFTTVRRTRSNSSDLARVLYTCFFCGIQSHKLPQCRGCDKRAHKSCAKTNHNSVKNHIWKCDDCITCFVCLDYQNKDLIISCFKCKSQYHLKCHDPPLGSAPQQPEWWCFKCSLLHSRDTNSLISFATELQLKRVNGHEEHMRSKNIREYLKDFDISTQPNEDIRGIKLFVDTGRSKNTFYKSNKTNSGTNIKKQIMSPEVAVAKEKVEPVSFEEIVARNIKKNTMSPEVAIARVKVEPVSPEVAIARVKVEQVSPEAVSDKVKVEPDSFEEIVGRNVWKNGMSPEAVTSKVKVEPVETVVGRNIKKNRMSPKAVIGIAKLEPVERIVGVNIKKNRMSPEAVIGITKLEPVEGIVGVNIKKNSMSPEAVIGVAKVEPVEGIVGVNIKKHSMSPEAVITRVKVEPESFEETERRNVKKNKMSPESVRGKVKVEPVEEIAGRNIKKNAVSPEPVIGKAKVEPVEGIVGVNIKINSMSPEAVIGITKLEPVEGIVGVNIKKNSMSPEAVITRVKVEPESFEETKGRNIKENKMSPEAVRGKVKVEPVEEIAGRSIKKNRMSPEPVIGKAKVEPVEGIVGIHIKKNRMSPEAVITRVKVEPESFEETERRNIKENKMSPEAVRGKVKVEPVEEIAGRSIKKNGMSPEPVIGKAKVEPVEGIVGVNIKINSMSPEAVIGITKIEPVEGIVGVNIKKNSMSPEAVITKMKVEPDSFEKIVGRSVKKNRMSPEVVISNTKVEPDFEEIVRRDIIKNSTLPEAVIGTVKVEPDCFEEIVERNIVKNSASHGAVIGKVKVETVEKIERNIEKNRESPEVVVTTVRVEPNSFQEIEGRRNETWKRNLMEEFIQEDIIEQQFSSTDVINLHQAAVVEENIVNKDAEQEKIAESKDDNVDDGPNCLEWSVSDVEDYFVKRGLVEEAAVFKEQEIDGLAMLLLKRCDLIREFNFKLGTALRLYNIIKEFQHYKCKDRVVTSA